jgi:hypothetical protein
MKKTKKNQNMPDQTFTNNESANTASLNNAKDKTGKPDRYIDSNLNQSRGTRQRYDDQTGTVENGIG